MYSALEAGCVFGVLPSDGVIFASLDWLPTFVNIAGGMTIPMGFSWANRTELVPGSQVRGHVGISFDTAPLFLLNGLKP